MAVVAFFVCASEDTASHLLQLADVGTCQVQAVQRAKQLQARVDVLAAQAAHAEPLQRKLDAAKAHAKASRAELAVLQRFKADHTSAAAATTQRQQQLAQQLHDAQQEAASFKRHAEAQAAEAAAARRALQGLLAEVDSSQNTGDAFCTLGWASTPARVAPDARVEPVLRSRARVTDATAAQGHTLGQQWSEVSLQAAPGVRRGGECGAAVGAVRAAPGVL